MKIPGLHEVVPPADLAKEVGFDYGVSSVFLAGAIKAGLAVKHAIQSGNPIEAGLWGLATVGATFMAAQFFKGGVDTIREESPPNTQA